MSDHTHVQRRTLRVLVLAQVVGAVGITIGIATASLLARDLSGSDTMAGLAQTFQTFGTAATAFALGALMGRRGRRPGLVGAYLTGALGAFLAVVAGVVESLPLLFVGTLLLGAVSAANAASRYAATDLATPETTARALSVVVWATTIGAVAGPNLTGPAAAFADQLGIPELTGPFALGAVGMLTAALVVAVGLRPDPLLLADGVRVAPAADSTSSGRVGAALRADPGLAAGMLAMAAAHAVMVSVMVMTPLHMEHGGSTLEVIGVVISVHVFGMFGFSPLVGAVADRFGRATTIGCGALILLVSLAVAGRSPMGTSSGIFLGLFLLGLGWSFATIGSSAVVADRAPHGMRTRVQGTSDSLMSLTAAGGSALSGVIVGGWGYPALNLFAALFALAVLAAAFVVRHSATAPALPD
ncbi:MAG: MFS transporter [Nocardioides sp.]